MTRKKKLQQKQQSKGKKNKGKESEKQQQNRAKGKKKNGWKPKGPELEDELYKMGLRVKYMLADGNCFFRALGDQLYGHDRDHLQIRAAVMDFMESNRALFELFVEPCLEENEDFDSYITQMREAAHWAGDFEVHAASLCFEVDICIYQIDNESLQCLCNKNPTSKRVIHISYHGGEHYNSVRNRGDYDEAPPRPIVITSAISNTNHSQNWSWKDEKRIMEDTGCFNDGIIHSYMKEYDGNVNAVVERVIEWMKENNCMSEELRLIEDEETNPLNIDCTCSEDEAEAKDKAESSNSPIATPSSNHDTSRDYNGGNKVLREDSPVDRLRKPANNKPCPCGSRKPYKKCCKIMEKKRQRDREQREVNGQDLEDSSSVNTLSTDMAFLYI